MSVRTAARLPTFPSYRDRVVFFLNGQTAEMPGVARMKSCPVRLSDPAAWGRAYFSASATWRLTAMKLSGLTEIESMPHSTRKAANSG